MAWIYGLLLSLLILPGCGAPASVKVGGRLAEQIQAALQTGHQRFDAPNWNDLLLHGAHDSQVNYAYFQAHRAQLDDFLGRLASVDLSRLEAGHLKALLINGYNALTIRSILDHPGVSSIREIDGVWKTVTHRVGGFDLTLDALEHTVLRPFFKDPRIHFAVNCASRSCAPLAGWAFDGDRIDEQMESRTSRFMQDPSQVRVEDGVLRLSSYFKWYGQDFTAAGWKPRAESVPAFVARYATPAVKNFINAAAGQPRISFLDYDWSLNGPTPPPAAAGESPETAGPASPQAGLVVRLRRFITGLGPVGMLLYALAYTCLTIFFVPASALTIGAGVAYGVVLGTVVVSVGSVGGAAAAFLIGRYLLRSRVEKWLEGKTRFAAIDRAVAQQGWKIVGLTRLSPVFPFNLLNYAYALTAVRFWPYVLASWIAMLPGTLLYVYIGAASADVAEAATGGARGWGRTALQITGVLATLVVTVMITRMARRALAESTAPAATADDS